MLTWTGASADHRIRVIEQFNCGNGAKFNCPPGAMCDDFGARIAIVVRKDGTVSWNGVPVNDKTLSDYLAEAARMDPAPSFDVQAEFDIPYGQVARVLFKLQRLGAHKMMCIVPGRSDNN